MKNKVVILLLFLVFSLIGSEKADFSQFSPVNDPVLNKIAEKVSMDQIESEEIQAIIHRMLEISDLYRSPSDSTMFMVGLAAPQIGISKRIILVDQHTTREQKVEKPLVVLINPEIIERFDDLVEETFEGCFSAGNLLGIVPRFQRVKVRAFNEKAELVEQEYTGFTARIIQHEIDHLNGIRFPDRITDETKLHWVEEDEKEEYRKNYQNWKRSITRQEWNKLSGKDFNT